MRDRASKIRAASRVLLLCYASACANGESSDTPAVEVSAQGLTAPSNSSAQANANAAAPAAAAAQPLSDAERQAQQDIAHERVDELDATHKRAYQLAERDALRAALATKRDLLAQVRASRANAQASERGQLDDEISRLQDNVTTADQKLQALDAERN